MSFAETAHLAAELSLKGNFASQMKGAQKALGSFDAKLGQTQTRAFRAGQQIGTGIKNGLRIATVAVGAVAGLLLKSAKDGQAAANVQKIYAQAIQNSGKVSQAQVAILNAQQTALLNLAGVDDELIKTEQTRLITMGLSGDAVAKLTPLILDLSKSTGIDLLTATTAVGKATLGNVTSLQRLGIVLPKLTAEQKKTATASSQLDIVTTALNTRFGGTTAALSGSLDTRLAVLREKLANVREEAGLKLLPVMTRIVDVVGQKLVPAFGEFIDGILPSVISGLDKLSGFLEGGGATSAIKGFLETARALAPAIQSSAEITGTVIKTAVDLFRSLPPEIQSLAIAGLAVNKLTGGLVTNIAGGLISSVLKQLVSGVVNVSGAVVNVVGGGIPGVGGLPGIAAGAGGLSLGAATGVIVTSAVTAAVIGTLAAGQIYGDKNKAFASAGLSPAEVAAQRYYTASAADQATIAKHIGQIPPRSDYESGNAKLAASIRGTGKAIDDLALATKQAGSGTGKAIDDLAVALALKKAPFKPPDAATAHAAQVADRVARGIKDTGPSKTLAPRFAFLAASHSAAKDIAVGNALAVGFERHNTPAFKSIANLKGAIKSLQADQKTFSGKNAKTIGGYVDRLKAELVRKQLAVSITTSTTTVINGRILDAQLSRYSSSVVTQHHAANGGG